MAWSPLPKERPMRRDPLLHSVVAIRGSFRVSSTIRRRFVSSVRSWVDRVFRGTVRLALLSENGPTGFFSTAGRDPW